MAEKRPFRAYQGDAPYLFISYSHKDAAQVYPIIEKLFLSGYNVWYDQGIPNNAILDMEIARHITRCEVFVLFLSKNPTNNLHRYRLMIHRYNGQSQSDHKAPC